jgi:hypothetical protein
LKSKLINYNEDISDDKEDDDLKTPTSPYDGDSENDDCYSSSCEEEGSSSKKREKKKIKKIKKTKKTKDTKKKGLGDFIDLKFSLPSLLDSEENDKKFTLATRDWRQGSVIDY